MMIYRLLLVFFIGFMSVTIYGQNINEAAARAELEKRGYDADRFKQEMLKKGVNPDDAIDPNNPTDVARAKKAAEEVMAMLDAEKKHRLKLHSLRPPRLQSLPSNHNPKPKPPEQ